MDKALARSTWGRIWLRLSYLPELEARDIPGACSGVLLGFGSVPSSSDMRQNPATIILSAQIEDCDIPGTCFEVSLGFGSVQV